MTTTTKRSAPPLGVLIRELRSQAERSGDDRSLALSGGARVAFRVRDGVVTFAVSRKDKRVSDVELTVFKAAAGVPADAERLPAEGQKPIAGADGTYFQVGWRWKA